jgi:hypothetical protein
MIVVTLPKRVSAGSILRPSAMAAALIVVDCLANPVRRLEKFIFDTCTS